MTGAGVRAARCGDLVITGGASGPLDVQMAALVAALETQGAGLGDLCLLRVFFRPGSTSPAGLRHAVSTWLAGRATPAASFVPVGHAGAGDGAISVEAVAVIGRAGVPARVSGVAGDGLANGIRRGRFLFLGAALAQTPTGLTDESRQVMTALGRTLADLGAGFGDVVRMNRWYHAAGTRDAWEPSARAVAAFYAEPGPIATALSLPVPLDGGAAIQIELMGMIGEDGACLPKRHSWPAGHWDWPIHLPYKHGLACDGFGFVGGQVSLDETSAVIDPDDQDRQVTRSLGNIARVIDGFGAAAPRLLHLGVYHEMAPTLCAGLSALATAKTPAVLAGFPFLSYPGMRVEIEAIVALQPE